MTIRAVNPTTDETINTYEEMAPAEVTRTIAQAHDAFLSWRQTSVAARAQRMQQAAQILREQATAYATLIVCHTSAVVAAAWPPVLAGGGNHSRCGVGL